MAVLILGYALIKDTPSSLIFSWLSRSYLNVRGANEPPGVVNEQNKVCVSWQHRCEFQPTPDSRGERLNAQLIKNRNKGMLMVFNSPYP